MVVAHRRRLICRDNSGIRAAYTIHLRPVMGRLATALCSLSRVVPNRKLRRGDLLRLVVVADRALIQRRSATTVRTNYNGALWLKKDGSPSASRVYSGVYLEARHTGYTRLAVVARGLL